MQLNTRPLTTKKRYNFCFKATYSEITKIKSKGASKTKATLKVRNHCKHKIPREIAIKPARIAAFGFRSCFLGFVKK